MLGGILTGILVLISVDLVTDAMEGVRLTHLLVEIAAACGAGIGITILLRHSFRKKNREIAVSRRLADESAREAGRWKAESEKHVRGLSLAIDAQFDRWSLSRSEREVALLLLKGLSLKEIASLRDTSEKTVRAQSGAVYSKSGLGGRSELSAYFMEDLLQPPAEGGPDFR